MPTKPTKGPWKYKYHPSYNSWVVLSKKEMVAGMLFPTSSSEDSSKWESNAKLIAEAGTVYHETGLTPRELQREIQDFTKYWIATVAGGESPDTLKGWQFELYKDLKHLAAIAAAQGKATGEKDEGKV